MVVVVTALKFEKGSLEIMADKQSKWLGMSFY